MVKQTLKLKDKGVTATLKESIEKHGLTEKVLAQVEADKQYLDVGKKLYTSQGSLLDSISTSLTNIQNLLSLHNQDILSSAEFQQGQEKEFRKIKETVITQLDQGKNSIEDLGKVLTRLTEAKDQQLIPDARFEEMRSILVQKLVK